MDKDRKAFKCLRGICPQLSDAKVKEDIFVASQIRTLMKDENVKNALNVNVKVV